MRVKDFLAVLQDGTINIQLVGAKNQLVLANGSILKKGELRKYDEWEIKNMRIDEWMNNGCQEREIELSIAQ